MADIVDAGKRSQMMAEIRGKNTKPELIIRQELHRLGFRFRLHRKDLPGKPDLVLSKYGAAILVNGCFWHGHNCSLFKWPSTRPEFWRNKIEGNIARDERNRLCLGSLGWRQFIVWECALKGRNRRSLVETISKCANWLAGSEWEGEVRESEEGLSF